MMRSLYFLLPLAPALIIACDSDDDGNTSSSTSTSSSSSSTSGTGGAGGSSGTGGSGGSSTSTSGTGGGGGGGGGDCTPDPDCEAVLGAFAACGGDITGTWNLHTACHVWGGPGPDPNCTENVVEIATGPAAGTWVFDGSNVTVTGYQVAQTGHSLYSSNCPSTPGDCATIEALTQTQWPTACCKEIDSTTCECFATADLTTLGDPSGTYTTNGNTLTLSGTATEYCVNGNVLSIRYDGGTEDEVVEVFDSSSDGVADPGTYVLNGEVHQINTVTCDLWRMGPQWLALSIHSFTPREQLSVNFLGEPTVVSYPIIETTLTGEPTAVDAMLSVVVDGDVMNAWLAKGGGTVTVSDDGGKLRFEATDIPLAREGVDGFGSVNTTCP